jgi:hypothetical protein
MKTPVFSIPGACYGCAVPYWPRSTHLESVFIAMLLLSAGDVEVNPGPALCFDILSQVSARCVRAPISATPMPVSNCLSAVNNVAQPQGLICNTELDEQDVVHVRHTTVYTN